MHTSIISQCESLLFYVVFTKTVFETLTKLDMEKAQELQLQITSK